MRWGREKGEERGADVRRGDRGGEKLLGWRKGAEKARKKVAQSADLAAKCIFASHGFARHSTLTR
jgi:hypothetical protein